MRASIVLAGLVVGLAAANCAHAQFMRFGNNNSSVTNRFSGADRTGHIGPNTYVGSPFRLRNLFHSFTGNIISNRQSVGYTTIPDPNSPEYLKAFGYRKLH